MEWDPSRTYGIDPGQLLNNLKHDSDKEGHAEFFGLQKFHHRVILLLLGILIASVRHFRLHFFHVGNDVAGLTDPLERCQKFQETYSIQIISICSKL